MCVCVFVISKQSTGKKPHYVSDVSKPDLSNSVNTHQSPSGSKVPRLDMCRSILSLSKIAHQIWHDQPLSQRNRTTGRTVAVEVGGDKEVGRGGWTKSEKGEGVSNIRWEI